MDCMDPEFVKFYNKCLRDLPKSHHYPISEYRNNPSRFEQWRSADMIDKISEPTYSDTSEIIEVPVSRPIGYIKVNVYNFKTKKGGFLNKLQPAYIHFHGGGGVVGRAGVDDLFLRKVVEKTDAVVFDVEYRLSPEYRAPTAAYDGYDTLNYVISKASKFHIDEKRIAVGGVSAGANIAAVICQLARDNAEINKIVLQLLIVPVIDARIITADGKLSSEISYESWIKYKDNPVLPFDRMKWFHDHLFGPQGSQERERLIKDPHVSPICGNLKNVAPAFIGTAEIDVLRDEGKAYADALQKNGVKVEYNMYEKMPHSFLLSPLGFENSRKAIQDSISALDRAFNSQTNS